MSNSQPPKGPNVWFSSRDFDTGGMVMTVAEGAMTNMQAARERCHSGPLMTLGITSTTIAVSAVQYLSAVIGNRRQSYVARSRKLQVRRFAFSARF